MTESKINYSSIREESPYSKLKNKKSVKNQIPFGILVTIGIIISGILLSNTSIELGLYWIVGISFGFILQKSRFCFTASMRDPYITGSTALTKAVLVAFAITTIGFTAIKFGAYSNGLDIPGQNYIAPISFATIIGAFMFGIGMVISGGCGSGTIMRIGEGFLLQVLTLFFFIIGSLWGAHDFGWWKKHIILKGKAIFLPDIFGWLGAVIIQLLLIAILYILADKWQKIKQDF
ncbi:YeeE/YedE family protein [Clostridium sp. D2Q-14]|uniref:YeeE/YedE thiosulfate transporter family protein n=1 Tax=Anaeromonas gelatinilytica TaxID=2683194 RepID=UPI00193BB9CA|nr:YeeE/YedE thiosulfate transporter family protein [Anaeromonas gelatinilytica]MBS4534152.1 YeeE/YedE family protein [Anaeromonas gelatinilytica]